MKNQSLIRFAQPKDLLAIVEIYNQAIRSQSATGDLDEFTVAQRESWFEKFSSEDYPIYVFEKKQRVLGYCTISPYRAGRRAMSEVAEISYYVDYEFHGQGVATALIKNAISDCRRINKKNLLAILLDINVQSQGLLRKFGFEQWGHLPDIVHINGRRCGHDIFGLKVD